MTFSNTFGISLKSVILLTSLTSLSVLLLPEIFTVVLRSIKLCILKHDVSKYKPLRYFLLDFKLQESPDSLDLDLAKYYEAKKRHSTEVGYPNSYLKESRKGSEFEASASVTAALEMLRNGKIEKASKLFKHAMNLYPNHPDVLNHYGEFLEQHVNDVVEADHLYSRALTHSPLHSQALINRQRTSRVVEEIDANRLKEIDEKRDQLARISENNSALRRIKKEAYFQYVYHTVGIEGNTMSLSQTRNILETRMAVGGKSIMEHNEILGLDAALKYLNSSLVQRIGAITLDDILEIHRKVMGFVDPEESGMFRKTQVFVGDHVPPSPNELDTQMKEFIEWLNSDEVLGLHPVKYAALAHYKLVFIHPFTDGNGRTSRLLMNLILMQAGYPPTIIRKQDRLKYYEYLKLANQGDVRPFIRFIAECTERTLDVYLWATTEYSGEIPALEQEDSGHTILPN